MDVDDRAAQANCRIEWTLALLRRNVSAVGGGFAQGTSFALCLVDEAAACCGFIVELRRGSKDSIGGVTVFCERDVCLARATNEHRSLEVFRAAKSVCFGYEYDFRRAAYLCGGVLRDDVFYVEVYAKAHGLSSGHGYSALLGFVSAKSCRCVVLGGEGVNRQAVRRAFRVGECGFWYRVFVFARWLYAVRGYVAFRAFYFLSRLFRHVRVAA